MCVEDEDDDDDDANDGRAHRSARAITVIGGFVSTCSFWRHDDTCWRRRCFFCCLVCLLNRHFSLASYAERLASHRLRVFVFVCVCTHQSSVITHFEFCVLFFLLSFPFSRGLYARARVWVCKPPLIFTVFTMRRVYIDSFHVLQFFSSPATCVCRTRRRFIVYTFCTLHFGASHHHRRCCCCCCWCLLFLHSPNSHSASMRCHKPHSPHPNLFSERESGSGAAFTQRKCFNQTDSVHRNCFH